MRLLAILFCLLVCCPIAAAQTVSTQPVLEGSPASGFIVPFGLPTVSFSADLHMEIAGSVSEGRQVVIPHRERWERRAGKFTVVSILYTDLLVGYAFIVENKVYTEFDLRSSTLQPDNPNSAYAAKWTVTREGEDVDDGLVRTRYHVQSIRPNGDSYVATVWLADAYNLIVQGEGVSTVKGVARPIRFKLSNIKTGPQDPSLFYPPPDFKQWGTGVDAAVPRQSQVQP